MGDVAHLAQVSTQTVSRVINANAHVKPEKREAVLSAMRTLGYIPNTAARAMKTGRYSNIGVIYQTLHPVGNRLALEGIVSAASARGYRTNLIHWDSLLPTSSDPERAVLGLGELAIDVAIVILSSSIEVNQLNTQLRNSRLPIVTLGGQVNDDMASVIIDQHRGTQQAVQHLLDLGHPTVHHITGPEFSLHARERELAWKNVLENNQRPVPKPIRGNWTPTSGFDATRKLLRRESPTAIFVANDQMALGAFRAILAADLRIPEDISIIGFDNIDEACQFPTPLTTVDQHWEVAGQSTLRIAVEVVDTGVPISASIPTDLILRDSTAAPRPVINPSY